jgi:hypothetical protein
VEIGSDLYFKIDKAPPLYNYDFRLLFGKWFKIDLEKSGETIGVQALDDENIRKDVEEKLEEVFDVFDKTNIFEKIKRSPDEKISDRDNYHLSYSAEASDLVEVFQQLYPMSTINKTSFEKMFGQTTIEAWIDKKTYFLNKMEISLDIKGTAGNSALQAVPAEQQLELKFSYVLSDIDIPIKIEAPNNARQLRSFSELLMMIQPTSSSNLLLQKQILGSSIQTREFGNNVLFYERVLRLLTLFPSTI